MFKEAEARGAEEQRRKDAEGSLRPMSEAEKSRTPILAKIHDDLFPRVYPERKDLKCWNGRWVVISHTGILADGFDIGWGMAAPVGHGGLTDDWFVGWKPVDCPTNVAALEAERDKWRLQAQYETDVAEAAIQKAAAMESRIAELVEAEQLARADAARFAWVVENTGCFWYGLPGFGPVSGRSHTDRMKDLRSAIDKNMARAALTREGGV